MIRPVILSRPAKTATGLAILSAEGGAAGNRAAAATAASGRNRARCIAEGGFGPSVGAAVSTRFRRRKGTASGGRKRHGRKLQPFCQCGRLLRAEAKSKLGTPPQDVLGAFRPFGLGQEGALGFRQAAAIVVPEI